ncbi:MULTISPECIES: single-stranded DNA-binding protein [Bacillota]|uniref:single-stranded DNA-binding protein n=1 Tax=Bacillota TaxID=1239 RepID=UPI0039EF1CA9
MLNNVILTGRLTKTPEERGTEENPVTVFTLAVNRSYTNQQGEKQADFIQIKAFKGKKLAQNCSKFLRKGMLVGVKARLQSGSYQKDGKTIFTLEVIAEDVQFLEPIKKEAEPNNPSAGKGENNSNRFTPEDDPFPGSIDFEPNGEWPFS